MIASNDHLKKSSIFVVDDVPENLKSISRILFEKDYDVLTFPDGNSALEAARANPPHLILLDINMPGMNGYQVCEILKADAKLSDIPIIFISGLGETSDVVKGFSVGGVDYITRPFKSEEIQARVEIHLKLRYLQLQLEKHIKNLYEQVQVHIKDISDSHMAAIFAMAKLAHTRDDDTGRHLERVQAFCKHLLNGLSETQRYKESINVGYMEDVIHASPLHDIGKVGIPDSILLKPSRLTPEEFEIMKTHTIIGSEMLEEVRNRYPKNNFYNVGIAIARHHHERWDGKGYPDGLSGEDIPLSARIMAVADVYEALKSKRCYKDALSHEESCEIIKKGSGTQFDSNIVEVFLKLHEKFKSTWEELQD
jgi:putative two-component system response regulator